MSNFGIFFDLDGTLVNSLADICGNLNTVRKTHGLEPLAESYLITCIGKGVENLIAGGFPEYPASRVSELVLEYRDQYFRTPFVAGFLYPGVHDALRHWRAHPLIKLGVATNKTTSLAEKTLAHYLPDITFDVIHGPEKVSKQKPAKEHLLETLARVGVEPKNAWFCGDDPVDRASAEAAGVKFFAAGWGFGNVGAEPGCRLTEFTQLVEKIPLPPIHRV